MRWDTTASKPPDLRRRLAAWLARESRPGLVLVQALEPFDQPAPAGAALLERLFRWLDGRIYGGRALPFTRAIRSDVREASAPARPSPPIATHSKSIVLRIMVAGEALDRLDAAVRARIGRRGQTLPLAAWAIDGDMPRLLFEAECCLDHKSLTRSIGWTAAKVPSVIRAAVARASARGAPEAAEGEKARGAGEPLSAARLLFGLAWRALRRLIWMDQWYLQLHDAGHPHAFLPGRPRRVLRPPRACQWADPFLLRHQQRLWVFFEEMPFAAARGHIAVAELRADGTLAGPPRVALREPWHLSYPFLWQEGDGLFMIPESAQHRTVDLYACSGDLTQWTKRATLLDGERWVDATVARFDGRLWMLCTHASDDEACMHDELHAFWADRIEGPWHPHRLNPVKIDARSARPAGRMRVHEGRLHRIVQDCSADYGGAVSVQRIDELDEHRFAETEVARLPWPGPGAARPWHTVNTDGPFAVIDALGRRFRWC